jgi:hypothetical protein
MATSIKITSEGAQRKLFVNGDRITGFTGLKVEHLDSFDALPEVIVTFSPYELEIDISEGDICSDSANQAVSD